MKQEKESGIFVAVLFVLLPYLMTVLILGREACPVIREISLEEYVVAVTASQISWDYSKEAIKAQTVIARTNLYLKKTAGEHESMIHEAADQLKSREMNGKELRKFRVFQEAARETEGQLLKLNHEIKELPYHALSQGRTRDGAEILGQTFSYIVSVETAKDIESPLYVEGCYFSLEELEKRIQKRYSSFAMGEAAVIEIKAADSTGYVMQIQIGNQEFQGEQIKEILELPSSCFTVQRLEKQVRFLCRGRGHGLGMSQYAAQKMAEEGKTYEEILQYFFPKLQLEESTKE